ncbi:cystatin-like protein [Drosophila rhopaloa]|uniref:Cystatin domain-containing protein n=1 Tax=Drosophila rhopaloa TaxID=1041015 RepID=A0ABM5HCL6_DRORH|nr:cystatin-like protein [Drosophila rhopaloa]
MSGLKSMCIFGLVLLSLAALPSSAEELILNGVSELEGDQRKEALALLNATLAQLATGNGPSYKAINVTSVTGQVVSGTLNTYELELDNGSDKKQCNVKIWTRPWLQKDGTNIKIKCTGDDGEIDSTW